MDLSSTSDVTDLQVYATPSDVSSVEECLFYHSMEIPGHGVVEGQWDLRGRVSDYIGGIELAGRRVLEIGTASGFLCFSMEQQGAEVVAYDLSPDQPWDVVPLASADFAALNAERREAIAKLNNAWWFNHKAFRSRAKMVYGTVYDVPAEIGPVDVSLYCAVLLHVRDPFLALQSGLRLTRDTVVVTDLVNPRPPVADADAVVAAPVLEFIPDARKDDADTWWYLNPHIVQSFLGVLGFEDTRVYRHRQKCYFGEADLFTVVGHRTKGGPDDS